MIYHVIGEASFYGCLLRRFLGGYGTILQEMREQKRDTLVCGLCLIAYDDVC